MSKCKHISCNHKDKIWISEENSYDIKRHPWCINCGVVKNISTDRPKKLGFWMNILSRLSNSHKIKKCQIRLISKELQESDLFNDLYSISGSSQKKLFLGVIKKYTNLNLLV